MAAISTTLLDIKGLRELGPEFHRRLVEVAAEVDAEPSYMAAVMAFESRLDPKARNPWSRATGLIQFMPATATRMGTTVDAIQGMTAVEQLELVKRYFASFKGRLRTVSDHYMAVLWPAAVGKPESSPLFSAPGKTYEQNAGLDRDKDSVVTKAEASRSVESFVVAAQGRPRIDVDMTPPPPGWNDGPDGGAKSVGVVWGVAAALWLFTYMMLSAKGSGRTSGGRV